MPDNPHQSRKPLIAAIIPMYNEERNVTGVLDVLRATCILDEIILVDDGSSDKTFEILNQAAAVDRRIQVIRHDTNRGKGQAIFYSGAVAFEDDPEAVFFDPGTFRSLLQDALVQYSQTVDLTPQPSEIARAQMDGVIYTLKEGAIVIA